MGVEEEVVSVISELQAGIDRSLFTSLTLLRTRLIKSAQARAQLLQLNAAQLLLNLLGEKTRHGHQKKMPDLIMSIIANLCLDKIASVQILKCGGLETIATFTLAAEHESLQNRGVRALSNLAQHEGVVEELFNLEVPEFVTLRLLETEDEECRVTYCRAIQQIGKTDSAVRRLVEDTVAVQALASMLKLDNKTLALKGLRTLAELSALRCCAQFAGQVLAAKVEEELVNFSEDENSDMAYFALSLIHRLCEQGLVRPSLGAAGAVKLLVRLMASTERHVNRVSVLNCLCLCSMDSVNRNRILDAGGLEVFVSVLNGQENIRVIHHDVESSEPSPSTSEGKAKATNLTIDGSTFHRKDKSTALKKSQFHVLYDRIIGCLVNFIYHDKCFAKLVDLGLVDVLIIHLQRCSNYQINNHAGLKKESEIMENEIANENINLIRQLKNEKSSTYQFNSNEYESNDNDDTEMAIIQTDSMDDGNPICKERSRHESKGFELNVDSERLAKEGIHQLDISSHEESNHDTVLETTNLDEEENKISQNIYSRDPLNIDIQDLGIQNPSGGGNASLESVESSSGNFSEESGTPTLSSRKVKHTFSINSPTYQSEISRRSEEVQCSGVTCKDYSNTCPLHHAQNTSPNSVLNSSWPASPASGIPSRMSSPRGFQSPYSPLSANASYYSPTQSSPPYNCASISPLSSVPPYSPPSSSSQAGQSPALSWVSSSVASPGQRSLASSPVHSPPYQSPFAGTSQGSFSPLRPSNYPGSPLHSSDANFQVQEVNSPLSGAEAGFQSSPGLFSDTNSQIQTLPVLSFGMETLTQSTLTGASPIYSATDDEDDDEDNGNNNSGQTTSTLKEECNEIHPMPSSSTSPNTVRDEVLLNTGVDKGDCDNAQDSEDISINNGQSQRGLLPTSFSTSGSNEMLSSDCDPLEGESLTPSSSKIKTSSLNPISSSASPKTSDSVQSPQRYLARTPSKDKQLVPRSSKVAKRFQRMLSAPCPGSTSQSLTGFKKRGSITLTGVKDSTKEEESEASTIAISNSPNIRKASFSSPVSACSSSSIQQDIVAANSSKHEKSVFSTSTSEKHRAGKGRVSDEKMKKIKQTTESNIFILLSSCSVKPDILSKLVKTDVLVNLLSYIRNAPAPLQRCLRILKRLCSNQAIFSRLILAYSSTLIIKSLILEDDGTFPKTMFCTEWEDLFGQLRRSRMNISDLLPFNKSSDDNSATGSQASDFGQRLDFEFGGDAYNVARMMSSTNSLAHRMFRDLYHNIRGLSSESQSDWDTDSMVQGSDLIYQPGVSREETRVRVGLKLLACLSTVATSSYGEGEIQHLSQGGKPTGQLSCRIFMLHIPVVWGRIIRHQFALKHQMSWDALLPNLFTENIPTVVKTAIFIGLSFNLHLDFPPKLVKQMPNLDILQSKASDVTGRKIPLSTSSTSSSNSHFTSTDSGNLGEMQFIRSSEGAAGSPFQTATPDLSQQKEEKASCSSACLSPGLFDEDEEDDTSTPVNISQHQRCPYWSLGESQNVTFIIKENGIIYRYKGNRATMMKKSEVFAAMLGGAYAERLQAEIELTDTKASGFECIIHYLHGCTSASCSLLSFLAPNLTQLQNLSGLVESAEEKKSPSQGVSSKSSCPVSQDFKRQKKENSLQKIDSDKPPTLEMEESFDNQITKEKCDKESAYFTTSDKYRANWSKIFSKMCDKKDEHPKDKQVNSDLQLKDTEEAFRIVEELTNICSDVLVLADRYLLTELVNRICATLSHVCLRAHTWEDLFKLASVFKLRPLAVDCMREALLVYEKPTQIVCDLQSLADDGYADQAIEALTLLLKSARIH